MRGLLLRVLPFLGWFEKYGKSDLRADFTSGLTVALVLIPQSMAYAQLAGLPAYYGLYAAFLPPFIAALFGSSRQLATGPVAIVSLMTAATLEPLATAGSEGYIAYAIFLALLVGIFQLSLGVLRLGVIVNFLSHPVVIGFTNAAAIIIASSQLSKFFGVYVDNAEHHYETIIRVVTAAWDYTYWPTFFLGVLALVIMVVIKRINPRIPFVLVAVAVTTVISWGMGLENIRTTNMVSIQSSQAHELIESFNADTNDIKLMSETRALLSPEANKLEEHQTELCQSCHSNHTVTLDMLRDDESSVSKEQMVSPKTSLQLHAMAGLLDRQIKELKERVSEKRSEIRRLRFFGIANESGMTYYPQDQMPAGTKGEGPTWRIKVGNRTIDKQSISLMGGGAVVGTIPKGLPKISLPVWDASVFGKLLIAAIIISILGFMEAISIAKAMAARTGQRLDPNQELIGQGLANILGSFGQSYAVSGSFSRSAVNIQAGAVSGISSVVTSAMVVIVLLFFTPLLYNLPQSVLAAVIMMAVIGLINIKGVVHAWNVQKSDGAISIISFIATLVYAPHLDRGILIGVLLSVGIFLYRKMKPGIAELSLWRDGHLRSATHYELKLCRHIAVIRFEGPLFFANTSYLEDEILDRTRQMPDLKQLIVVSGGINELDASGEEALSLLVERLRSGGYDISFCGFSERIIDTLHRSHLYDKIGDDHFFPTAALAIDAIWEKAHKDSNEIDCPLRSVVPTAVPKEEYKIRVLLVDDEEEFTLSTTRRLNRTGFEVQSAFNGTSALDILKQESFDVVILDVMMPGMGGMEVMREIRKRKPGQAVILLTGKTAVEDVVEGIKSGATDYLQKPCTMEDLSEKITKIYKMEM